jgi:predicted  nucleic acid-binding Zn-ribbon protein
MSEDTTIKYGPWSEWGSEHICKKCREVLEGDRRYNRDGICPYCGAKSFLIVDTIKKSIRTRKVTRITRHQKNQTKVWWEFWKRSGIKRWTVTKTEYENEEK